MVRAGSAAAADPEEKPSFKIKLGGKELTPAASIDASTKLKVKLPASTSTPSASTSAETQQPVKREKRTRKRKAPSPDDVRACLASHTLSLMLFRDSCACGKQQ